MGLTILEWPVAGIGSMTSQAQAQANGRNALQSTGPRTEAGIELTRFNAVRHGLRALQTVIPGEAPEEWEVHRVAVLEDLKPAGAVELALSEQIAAKLWRLGRVVRHEADLITIGQAKDELLFTHEKAITHTSSFLDRMDRTDIPNFEDVKSTRRDLARAEEKVKNWRLALQALENLHKFKDSDVFDKDEWPIFDALKEDLALTEKEADVFTDEKENFAVHHARTMLKCRGTVKDVTDGMVTYWRDDKIPELRERVAKAKKTLKNVLSRYEAAIDRLRLSRGLPDAAALDKIQRYEAHLERGLHRALERLQSLQEARGVLPSSHKPAVALAVIQAAPEPAGMASFGSFDLQGRATGPN
jgi:hypothetical protein